MKIAKDHGQLFVMLLSKNQFLIYYIYDNVHMLRKKIRVHFDHNFNDGCPPSYLPMIHPSVSIVHTHL